MSRPFSLYMLVGNPVSGSLSPAIHNAAFRALRMRALYVAVETPRGYLSQVVSASRFWTKGFNVTIPYKVDVMSLLDRLDRSASLVEAVNTVVNRKGVLVGYNTDGEGAMRALEKNLGPISGMRVVVLGAGGAARAIVFSLVQKGCQVVVANRTVSRAEALAAILRKKLGAEIRIIGLRKRELKKALSGSDLLINATSVGMLPHPEDTLVTADMLSPEVSVMDIVYKPLRTRLLREAEKAGCRTVDGLQMLVYQAALSFKLWTRRDPPLHTMMRAAKRAAEGRE